jgi:hypothetical protein
MKQITLILALGLTSNAISQLSNSMPSSGPVGIGTTTPVSGKQLTVNGHTEMLGDVEIDGQILLNNIVRMPGIADYAGAPGAFKVILIDAYGNVTKVDGVKLIGGLGALPEGIDVCVADEDNPIWRNAPYKLFSACPDVKVGIGTATPAHQLSVVVGTTFVNNFLAGNSLGSTTAVINAFAENHTDKLLRLGKKIGGTTEEMRLVVDNNGSMHLANGGADASFTIHNGTGHAFIVYDNGGNKILQLHDNGLLRSREIKVDIDTWPDYVFDQSYQLMDLKKLALYIQENHKLPGIPSSQDIEKNGLNLGKIQKLQMEKIEELTLYAIQQDAQLNHLAAENDSLKKQIQSMNERLVAIEMALIQK